MREKKLAPFQEVGRDFLAERKTALLADQMRLGKSAQAIRAADKIKARKILILCPSSSKLVWLRELNKWSTLDRSIQVIDGRDADINKNIDVTIINYDIAWNWGNKQKLLEMEFAVAFIDECHYLSGLNSNRSQAVLSNKDRTPLLSRCHYRWFISGTPLLNRPRDLYPVLASCATEYIKPYVSYKAFTRHFCGGYWDGEWIDKGATNTEELNQRLYSGFMLRRLRKDVLGEIPAEHQLIPVEAKGKEILMHVAKELEWSKSEAHYQKMDGEDEIATVRRKLGVYMVPAIVRQVNLVLSNEEKVVVFAYHKEVMDLLIEKLAKFNPVCIRGGMKPKDKVEAEDEFRDNPECRVIIGQIISAGVSVDFSASHFILFGELSWIDGEMEQAESRCSGMNQAEKVLIQFMVIKDSLGEHMLRTLIEKKNTIKQVIEQKPIVSVLFN